MLPTKWALSQVDAFTLEVAERFLRSDVELVADRVGQDPVDLFGHGAVPAAEARLEVCDRDAELHRGQGGGEGRVDVAGHDHQVGPVVDQERLEALHHPGGLLGVGAGPDLEHVVRLGDPELLEEDLRHHPVVMLSRVDDRLVGFGQPFTQSRDQRGHLYEIRPGAEHVHDSHCEPPYPCKRTPEGCLSSFFD